MTGLSSLMTLTWIESFYWGKISKLLEENIFTDLSGYNNAHVWYFYLFIIKQIYIQNIFLTNFAHSLNKQKCLLPLRDEMLKLVQRHLCL